MSATKPPTPQMDFADRAAVSLHRAGLFPESATLAEMQSLLDKTAKLIRIEHEVVTDISDPYWTLKAMRIYGGGFVSALAQAASHADDDNLAAIRKTWPGYWAQYEQIGEQIKRAALKENPLSS